MRLEPIGELTDEEIAEIQDTVTIPVVTYHYQSGKRKVTDVEFRIVAPAGADLKVVGVMAGKSVPASTLLEYITRSLTDEGKSQWQSILDDDDFVLRGATIGKIYVGLVGAHVNPVPTPRPAGSPRTSASTKKTSKAVSKKQPGRRVALKS